MVASFDALVRATARVAREFRHLSQVLAARLDRHRMGPQTGETPRPALRQELHHRHLFGRRVYVFPVSLVPVSFRAAFGDAADGTTDGTDAKP